MKKVIAIIMIFAMIMCMGACGGNSGSSNTKEAKYTIKCNDGTTRTMTAAEIYDMYKNDGRNFEKLLNGATISGTGTIEKVGNLKEQNWKDGVACAWGREIDLNVPGTNVVITTFFSPKDYYEEMYSGDKVSFTGSLQADFITVYIRVHYQIEGHYLTLK